MYSKMKKIITFTILGTLIVLCAPAYGEIFSQTHNDASGVTITTTVDTDRRSVLYDYDFSVLGSASYEQIKIGQPGFPTSTIDRHPSRDPESPSATGYIYFEGGTQFQVEYKAGADPPAVNWIKLHYVAGYRFDRFDPPNNNIQVTYRVPPPGQEDNIFVGAYTPVVTQNQTPVADAGPDQTVSVGDTVTLDGSGSGDVDGDPLNFSWSFMSIPATSTATLDTTNPVYPFFGVDVAGTYVVQLVVNDGIVDSAPDTVRISTRNSASPSINFLLLDQQNDLINP
jgi:hypothetical protein